MRKLSIILFFLLLASSTAFSEENKSAANLLQEGLYAEEIEGDIASAIKIYEEIIATGSADDSHTAQAMYRLGMCHVKKQDEQNAKVVFEKLVDGFPQQTSIIEKVKPLLVEMSSSDPAALMPPDTKIYLELGSPGRQIEIILNMLKDTQFANPLAAIGANAGNGQQKSPGDIMAALFNPGMMAEFKKIRGMAVGLIEIRNENPPMVAVLYPGKSDALRGMILAGLGMAGKAGEPIEGMQTLIIKGQAGVAYDDNVIIIAHPLEQLRWSVKQYKTITNEPSLSSQNKSFSRISRKSMEENALTIWLDGAGTYAAIAEQAARSGNVDELQMANAIVDFGSIEDIIAFLSIKEDGLEIEANVNFKDGHNCLAYNLIRTPNLSKTSFEAVPSKAVALVSLALNQASGIQVQTTRQTIKKLTGLNIGREIFANIEQISLFVLPCEHGKKEDAMPVVSNLGLSITSHNPQHTYQLFSQLLKTAEMLTNEQSVSADNEYVIKLDDGKKLRCCIGRQGRATVIAFSPKVLEDSLAAIKKEKSVLTAGTLQKAVAGLKPDTSKVAIVNLGGAIRIADDYIISIYDNPINPVHKTLEQLAKACDGTYVKVCSGESDNNFNINASLENIPALDKVFPLLMQLSKMDFESKLTTATNPYPADKGIVGAAADLKLDFKPGLNAVSHRVYFGTKIDELKLLAEVDGSDKIVLPKIEKDNTYYWRVDEVWEDGTVAAGDVWSFSTTGKIIGWWKFDETEGSIAADSSGNDNFGTLKGNPRWLPDGGKIGGVLQFDGDGDYVEIANESNFDFTGQFTVACWVKADSSPKNWQSIITKGDSAWRLHRWYDKVEFGCSGVQPPYVRVSVSDGEWHHVVGVYNGSKLYLYLDGDLAASEEASGAINTNDYQVYIGENAQEAGRYWNGLVDDVRIYNYGLSENEILAVYNQNE
ncbi:MAG: tetratricopeptide repeat protein [Planctomycetes bacterium]|nr:tetratricopeptide repeat protein [Planctomycetota bacterium]